jgi:hypothetical protein
LSTLDPGLASVVLDAVSDDDFERFGQAMLRHVLGMEFEPTGGMHDGGQDGFVQPVAGKPTHYVQISTRADTRRKIQNTIDRLKESGRNPGTLTYLTNRALPERDTLQDDVERLTSVTTRILDRRWITLQTQRDETASRIFADSFADVVQSAASLDKHIREVYSPSERMSIMSYMEVHAASEPDEKDLLPIAVDSAIYLALEGTDPEKCIFRSETEITESVYEIFPAVKARRDIDLTSRIQRLSSKQGTPRIRYHRNVDGYCLPFDVRSEFSEHGRKVRASEVAFWDSMKRRLTDGDVPEGLMGIALEACSFAIEKTFERQGLNFLASINGAFRAEEVKTYEFLYEKLAPVSDAGDAYKAIKACQYAIRHAFYSPNEVESEYTMRLFKAYSVEFAIRGDARVASYFSKLVKTLRLFVGTDVIVRALSEVCCKPVGRATQNALKMLSQAGAELILTEYVLEEVWHHIHSADLEFQNFYAPWEKKATLAEVQNSDRILIRAYFYGKLEPEYHEVSPHNWDYFLSLYGDSAWFRDPSGIDGFATFLRRKFNLKYVSKEDVERAVDIESVSNLEKEIEGLKKAPKLAWNDAYQTMYVVGERKRRGDVRGDSIYGFRNWWLTEEFKILDFLNRVGVHDQLTMHPQFLMNLFAASPGLSKVTRNFVGLFPTHFGLRITDRVGSHTMHRFLESAKAAADADAAKVESVIRTEANRWLGTRYRV